MCDFAGGWGEKDCTVLRELLPRRVKPLLWTDITWHKDGIVGTLPGVPMERLRVRPYTANNAGPNTFSVFRARMGEPGYKSWHRLDALDALCLLNHLITEEGNSG